MITFFKNENNGLKTVAQWEPNCWVNVEKPEEKDKQYLLEELGIPERFYNDIEDIDERPRIEEDNGWMLVLMRVPYKSINSDLPYATVPLGIVYRENICVSICFYQTEMIPNFVAYSNQKGMQFKDSVELSLRLLISSSVWFLKYLKQINQKLKSSESCIPTHVSNEDLRALLAIEKCLVYFTNSLKSNDILSQRIKNTRGIRNSNYEELLEDADIETRQALETTHIYNEILRGTTRAYASVISNNLNAIMNRLTLISIIIMIPTLVSGLYGMNVPNYLEENPYGFLIALSIGMVGSLIGLLIFVKRKWW